MSQAPRSLDDCIALVQQSVQVPPASGTSSPLQAPLELAADLNDVVITPTILFTPFPIDPIRSWYPLILKRPVDDVGYRQYSAALAKGMPALELFFSLCASPEGRQAGVKMRGFALGQWLYQVGRLVRRLKLGRVTWFFMRLYQAHLQRVVQSSKHAGWSEVMGTSAAPSYELQQTWALLQNNVRQVESLSSAYRELQENYQALSKSYALLQAKQSYLQTVSHPEAGVGDAASVHPTEPVSLDIAQAIEAYYVSFEDVHRGSTAQIQAGLNDYQAVMEGVNRQYPALDLGCGRGEWLQWLRERGIAARGIDSNAVMVRLCQEQGLDVQVGDVLSSLRAQASHSLSMVSSFHVIEHLPFEVLFAMVQEIHRVLIPGGVMILETPNPENVLVGSHTFYHDFSHRAPITPTSIEFLAQYHGFVKTDILRRNPYPREARVLGSDPLTERVNGHLCGPQDFALIARTPSISE